MEDLRKTAQALGLHYVMEGEDGILRKGSKNAFFYIDSKTGKRIRNPTILKRIKALVIPPGYSQVWISKKKNAHIQAIGRDTRNRKQYRYHAKWRLGRDHSKFSKVIEFAKFLPKIRAQVKKDLRKKGLPKPKVLATVVQLLEKTLIRVGNESYARDNGSFGLTTLQDRHVQFSGPKVNFKFKGKRSIQHSLDFKDPRLAKIIRECRDLPGQDLFQYINEDTGEVVDIRSEDVNEYLQEVTGRDFTAKDFRTWAGTVLCAKILRETGVGSNKAETKRRMLSAIECVAKKLGNTKSICRRSYIHPLILDSFLEGTTVGRSEEKAVMSFLRERA